MKKALVVAMVMVLGLGALAFADGALTGDWDTDISLYPGASAFGDFIKSFTSEVDVDYAVGGFTFGIESTFGLAGMTGMDFNVDGVLGAFTLKADIDFSPMILATSKTVYTTLQTASSCLTGFEGLTWAKKTVTKTYTAGFDDMELEASVSIAGVSLDAIFYLQGEDTVGSYTYAGNHATVQTASTGQTVSNWVQTGSATVASSTNQGAGWRLEASGSFGGATLTARAYFNLEDYWGSYYDYLDYYAAGPSLADYFSESGDWAIVCDDCISRFTGLQVILEDVSFACADFSAMVSFDCCGFQNVKFLVEDIGLGCCWDIGFDMMITFTTTSKTLTLDPSITLANSCFTISAGLDFTETDGSAFTLNGIEIYGIGLEYEWNGVTFSSETSWDLTENPILGPAYLGGATSSPTKIYVLQPDTHFSSATTSYDEDTGACTLDSVTPAINMTSGVGYWNVTSFACEKAYAWENFSIDVDGDSCCGGAYDISAAFYFGDIKELSVLGGTYYTSDGSSYDFYGTGYAGTAPTFSGWAGNDCTCCPCDGCSYSLDSVKWTKTYTTETTNTSRLFDWIETDVDVSFGLASNFDLTAGFDITNWGWEDFTFGFEFTF